MHPVFDFDALFSTFRTYLEKDLRANMVGFNRLMDYEKGEFRENLCRVIGDVHASHMPFMHYLRVHEFADEGQIRNYIKTWKPRLLRYYWTRFIDCLSLGHVCDQEAIDKAKLYLGFHDLGAMREFNSEHARKVQTMLEPHCHHFGYSNTGKEVIKHLNVSSHKKDNIFTISYGSRDRIIHFRKLQFPHSYLIQNIALYLAFLEDQEEFIDLYLWYKQQFSIFLISQSSYISTQNMDHQLKLSGQAADNFQTIFLK